MVQIERQVKFLILLLISLWILGGHNLTFVETIFSSDWVSSFTANLFADILVAIVIGLFITKYIENREKREEQREKLKIAANMVWAEINYNKKQLKLLIENLPKGDLPYPALEISAWEVIDKKLIIDGLKIKDIANLLHIYNRVKTINMTYYSMLDKVNWIEDLKIKPVIKKEFIDKLVDRCEELLKYIDEEIPSLTS